MLKILTALAGSTAWSISSPRGIASACPRSLHVARLQQSTLGTAGATKEMVARELPKQQEPFGSSAIFLWGTK
jgi:hypothetical protein